MVQIDPQPSRSREVKLTDRVKVAVAAFLSQQVFLSRQQCSIRYRAEWDINVRYLKPLEIFELSGYPCVY